MLYCNRKILQNEPKGYDGMDINLGGKIRELRKKKELSQEELAEKLGVSGQAVSKWENGTCYPDMTQIPVLANFFGVSLDELFNYDVTQLNAKIDAIIKEAGKYFWSNRDKCKEIYLNALNEYPSNERLLTELLDVYMTHGTNEEALPIAEQLVEEAKDVFAKCRAKSSLAGLYLRQDRYEDAKALIDTLPVMYPYMLCDQMRQSCYQLKGEDRLKWAKEWRIIEIQELYLSCAFEGQGYFETGQYDAALHSFGEYRRLIEMFMKSEEINIESYLWNGMQTHHWYSYLWEASCLLKLGQMDAAKEKLARAEYIVRRCWDDATYAKDPEWVFAPFREYYHECELELLGECPV